MSGGGGGGGTSTQSVRSVPDWAIPHVQAYFEAAYTLWQTNQLTVYTGDVTAAQNQDEVDGIAGLANRGRYGDQVISKAIAYEDDVINGGYLQGTKADFLAALALATGNSTTDFASVNSRIGRKPLFVGDPDSAFLAQTFVAGTPAIYNARMSALIYADNFRKERDIQNHGLAYGVEMGKHAAINAEALRRAGLYAREYLQGTYEISHKKFVEGQEISVANLEIFGNVIRALTGSQQTTTTQTDGGSKFMRVAGGVMAGAVTGAMIGSVIPGVGTVIGGIVGGVVGGLMGLFG
jgi:hypothetical protein